MKTYFEYGTTDSEKVLNIKLTVEFRKNRGEFSYQDYQKCVRIAKELRTLADKYNNLEKK